MDNLKQEDNTSICTEPLIHGDLYKIVHAGHCEPNLYAWDSPSSSWIEIEGTGKVIESEYVFEWINMSQPDQT